MGLTYPESSISLPSGFVLSLLPGGFAVCRLPAAAPLPRWVSRSSRFFALIRTPDELCAVCVEMEVPETVQAESGWRLLRVRGPLDFSLVGVLASLALPLAHAGVSIFALSTYDTDYVLVRQADLERAAEALAQAGHRLERPESE
jgi:uncharacterized protein